MPNDRLPEGTDHIIAGASGSRDGDDAGFTPAVPLGNGETPGNAAGEATPADGSAAAGGDTRESAGSIAKALRDKAGEHSADLRGQATDKVREIATQQKDRATAALEGVSRIISQAASEVDDKVGREYGDYARRAQEAVDGIASTLRDKDVDALLADARELARRSPVIAASAAAVLGFALVRLVRSGLQPEGAGTTDTAKG